MVIINNSSRSEGRRPERSEVNKFVGPKARRETARELSRANSSRTYIYIYVCMFIYFREGVRTVA